MNMDAYYIIIAAAAGFFMGLTTKAAEMAIHRRIYRNRRRKLAKMKYA